jgi:hypothetical protein
LATHESDIRYTKPRDPAAAPDFAFSGGPMARGESREPAPRGNSGP